MATQPDMTQIHSPPPIYSLPPLQDDSNELWLPNTRPMVISPNLTAALAYDEQSRNANASSNAVAGPSRQSLENKVPLVGLPPPPRPKSRATSLRAVHSPSSSSSASTSTLGLNVTDAQTPPPPTPQSPAVQQPTSPPIGSPSNPYINPPPRLPHLLMDSPAALTFPADRRSTGGYSPRSSIDSRIGDSPRSETRPSGSPLASSPESAGLPEGRQTFQRHLRYLSSLSKVDKILGIGKSLASGKNPESYSGRRTSDASLAEGEVRRRRLGGSRYSSGSTSELESGPSSPIIFAEMLPGKAATSRTATATTPAAGTGIDGGEAELDRDRRRSSVVAPVPGAAAASTSVATRPLISHGRKDSGGSTLRSVASSEESHDPPSSAHDTARISISSTLYQDSHYSIPFDPPYSAPIQNIMSSPGSDRESFIDLASPRSPDFRAQGFRINDHDRYSYRKDLANLADLSLQPSPPILSTVTVKPPIPTSPKPAFSKRSHSVQPPRNRPRSPDRQDAGIRTLLPSTTNLLDPKERADRVRQNRKLAQVFGQTPGSIEAAVTAATVVHDVDVPNSLLCAPGSSLAAKRKQQHLRGTVSMSVNTNGTPKEQLPRAVWPPPDGTKHLTLGARRHSSPLTPEVMNFLDGPAHDGPDDEDNVRHPSGVIVIGSRTHSLDDEFRASVRHKRSSSALTSPTSFIDLSEEDFAGDGVSIINIETPTTTRRPPFATSSSSASIYSFTSDELAEEDRRRKREKLAKLHRFLGSRVPANVILGQLSIDTALDLPPPASLTVSAVERPKQMDPDARKTWVRRRRSSSAAEFGGRWSDDIDRLKEELNDKEKAQNVKRAVKMEKMFGVAPPQTLYHTRAAPSSAGVLASSLASPSTPKQHRSSSYSPVSPHDTPPRNVNQSAYTRNKIKRKTHRPGTSESSEPLMNGFGEDGHPKFGFSEVYEHYRHSLNSLNDIIDRDDKASLERLHDLIHGDTHDHEPHLQTFTRQDEPLDEPPTPKAERRRSLPARASMTSLASEFSIAASIASPDPEETMFQTRRRRAAKLTQFFGVDYRELMSEILESLEKGLEEEGGRGTLKPDEVQELLVRLRKLKTKRNNFLG